LPQNALEEIAREVGDAVDSAADHVEAAAEVTGELVEKGARKTVDLTRSAVDQGVAQVTRFGRMVLAAWKFFERLSNPPWTPLKAITWAAIFLLVAVITVLAYQFKYGILTLPIVEEAGSRFVAWMAALGAAGLFGFTVVGTLFFMVIPTEPFFFVTLSGSTPVVLAIAAAAFGSTIGSCCNYGFGNRIRVSAGKKTGDERKLGKWGKRAHSKWGTVLLFLAAALPMPEIIALTYGIADYPFKKFVLVTLVGRVVKWSWIAAAFLLFRFSMG
jgi:membrane protein YqaA with SNARE-associated domain